MKPLAEAEHSIGQEGRGQSVICRGELWPCRDTPVLSDHDPRGGDQWECEQGSGKVKERETWLKDFIYMYEISQ